MIGTTEEVRERCPFPAGPSDKLAESAPLRPRDGDLSGGDGHESHRDAEEGAGRGAIDRTAAARGSRPRDPLALGDLGHLGLIDLSVAAEVPLQIARGLQMLMESAAYARWAEEDPWEFSVEWTELQRVGLTSNDGRWLIQKGLVRHAWEVTTADDARRQFVSAENLCLSARVCLVLTEDGGALARSCHPARVEGTVRHVPAPFAARRFQGAAQGIAQEGVIVGDRLGTRDAAVERPIWDRERRQLRVGRSIVKEFKVPAMNQEIVLATFEEELWPPKIDDPLPPKSEIDPQRRLHDTINSLNRRQRHRLIHFSADGLAQGIRWELTEARQA